MDLTLDQFLLGVLSPDTHKRIATHTELMKYLNNPDSSLVCEDLDQIIDGLAQWMNSSNYKIAQNGIEVLLLIIRRVREGFRPYVPSVLPAAVDRIGDSKDTVRDAAIDLVIKLTDVSSPQYVFDRMTSAFSHKLWRVREGVMLCLKSSLNLYGAKSLTLSKLVPSICKCLDDQNGSVRETAISTLVDIYRHVGERVRTDISKKGITASKLNAIFARFDDARDSGEMLVVSATFVKPDETFVRTKRCISATGGVFSKKTTSGKSAGAGGVDEESFMTSFVDVPKVNFFSARELTDHMTKIKETLSEDRNDWEKRVDCIKMVRSLIVGGASSYDEFLPTLRQLEASFQLSVKDLRSQIVREACITIAYMSQHLGNKFDHFAEAILQPLITLIPNTVKIMSTSGLVCINFVLQHTHSSRFIPIVTSNLSSKSNIIRRYCFEFLEQLLYLWQTHTLERHIAVIQDSIKKGMVDADADARLHARKAYWGFASHFKEQADSLLNSLDSSKQRLLQGELSNSSSSNSLNNACGGGGGPGKIKGRSASSDRNLTGISGLTKRRPLGAPTGPSRVTTKILKPDSTSAEQRAAPAKYPIVRSNSDLDLSIPKRAGRSLPRDKSSNRGSSIKATVPSHIVSPSAAERSRPRSRIGASQSQPGSRSGSPSSRLSYMTYSKAMDSRPHVNPRNSSNSRIPRSQGASREPSPIRYGSTSRDRSRGDCRRTAQRVAKGKNALTDHILGTNREAEQALANALLTTGSRSRYDAYDSDDAASETSSICSDHSYGSYGRTSEDDYGEYRPRQRRKIVRVRRDVGEILSNMSSGSWADRKEGLLSLQHIQTTRTLNKLEIKKVSEIFTRMFHEPHNKVFCVFMETLVEFIYIYNTAITDWLHILLTRLLTKLGGELLGSVTLKIQRALDAVRDNFHYEHQFGVLIKFIIDSTQTPSNKVNSVVRAGVLNYLHALIRIMDPCALVIHTDTKLAVTRIINWTTEPKSVDVRKSACAVIISLFDLNSPEFSSILSEIPKSFQEAATRILQSHLKNSSGDQAADVLAPRNTASPGHVAHRSKPTPRHDRDHLETENMNPEEIYNSIRQTSADIQNLSLNTKLDTQYDINMCKERDSTSQDSGIQSSLQDLRDGGGGGVGGGVGVGGAGGLHGGGELVTTSPRHDHTRYNYNPSHYQDGTSDMNGVGVNRSAALAEAMFDNDHNEELAYEPSDVMSDILAELSNHNERNAERSDAMDKLRTIVRAKAPYYEPLWDEHFKNILFVILETFGDDDPHIRDVALRIMKELLTNHPHRFDNYVELVIVRVMEAQKDANKQVVLTAESCAATMVSVLPSEQCLSRLQDFIRPANFPMNCTAIKLQNKVVEQMPRELLLGMLSDVVPHLILGCDHEESMVRKASVFCLVAIYMVVGDDVQPYLKELKGSKLKLLNLYITREQKKRAKCSSFPDAEQAAASSPTSSDGLLFS